MSYIIHRGKVWSASPEMHLIRRAMYRRAFGPPLWMRLLIRLSIVGVAVLLAYGYTLHLVGPVYLP